MRNSHCPLALAPWLLSSPLRLAEPFEFPEQLLRAGREPWNTTGPGQDHQFLGSDNLD